MKNLHAKKGRSFSPKILKKRCGKECLDCWNGMERGKVKLDVGFFLRNETNTHTHAYT